ncbi:MAG TPA: hypothetical protein VII06_36660 [Chloroflexota bacterium]
MDNSKTFDFAADIVKQLITLSTGIFAVTIAFPKVFGEPVPFLASRFLLGAWIAFMMSIISGLLTMMELLPAKSVWDQPVVSFEIGQLVFFVVGILLTLIFGWLIATRRVERHAGPVE